MILAAVMSGATAVGAVDVAKLQPPVTETKLIIYQPAIPGGAPRDGSCWTTSIAVLRAGAWRCTVGNFIQDPCFSVASLSGAVVCGADPAAGEKGFLMKLTRPLPEAPPGAVSKPWPWIMELADGAICEKLTGTMAGIGGESVGWGCNDSKPNAGPRPYYSGVLGDPKAGRVWKVEKIRFVSMRDPEHPFKVLVRKIIAVRTVWE
jgi:hypothetical protein